jgi:hypothetical protein
MRVLLVGGRCIGRAYFLARVCGNYELVSTIAKIALDSEIAVNNLNSAFVNAQLSFEDLSESMQDLKNKSIEPEPSRFMSKPKYNFKRR